MYITERKDSKDEIITSLFNLCEALLKKLNNDNETETCLLNDIKDKYNANALSNNKKINFDVNLFGQL